MGDYKRQRLRCLEKKLKPEEIDNIDKMLREIAGDMEISKSCRKKAMKKQLRKICQKKYDDSKPKSSDINKIVHAYIEPDDLQQRQLTAFSFLSILVFFICCIFDVVGGINRVIADNMRVITIVILIVVLGFWCCIQSSSWLKIPMVDELANMASYIVFLGTPLFYILFYLFQGLLAKIVFLIIWFFLFVVLALIKSNRLVAIRNCRSKKQE